MTAAQAATRCIFHVQFPGGVLPGFLNITASIIAANWRRTCVNGSKVPSIYGELRRADDNGRVKLSNIDRAFVISVDSMKPPSGGCLFWRHGDPMVPLPPSFVRGRGWEDDGESPESGLI